MSSSRFARRLAAGVLVLAGLWLAAPPAVRAQDGAPTVEEARAFVEKTEARFLELAIAQQRAGWVKSNFITEDTEILEAKANEELISATVAFAKQAARFDQLTLPSELRRKLDLLKLAMTLPAPADPAEASELTRIAASLEGTYGRGKYCPPAGSPLSAEAAKAEGGCLDLGALSRTLASSRDEAALREAWIGWHAISPGMRQDYARLMQLANKGAKELGYKDVGALWRSKYDMDPDAFAKEVDRLWGQVRPLYESLHAYVRMKLRQKYGDVVPASGPIPAHLLGNMWSQSWGNVWDVVKPEGADSGFDLTERLQAKKLDEREMVRYGERFFSSLGFAPLPETFWSRSLFVKPRDRDVVCHASAWDIDWQDDIRIKMCIEINDEDFVTIHHELGHNYYQRAYKGQSVLFADSANDGFHEAIGDTVALSITPEYLKKVGLIDEIPDPSKDTALLLRQALDKIAFLPFGLLIDQWRWKVASGEVTPENYNKAWWELRTKYQGIAPPVARTEAEFDPGAKYHVPSSVPYTRYFLAHILQYQFHRSLIATAGYKGPVHRGSIYGSAEAGAKLNKMLEMGISRPWPDALEAVTGTRTMDATAILDYFAPLKKWLDAQVKGQPVGWSAPTKEQPKKK